MIVAPPFVTPDTSTLPNAVVALNDAATLTKFVEKSPEETASASWLVSPAYRSAGLEYVVEDSGTFTCVTASTVQVLVNKLKPLYSVRRFSAVDIPVTYETVSADTPIELAVTLITARCASISSVGLPRPPMVRLATNDTIGLS